MIVVKKGNPKQIKSVEDLLKGDVKTAIANPDAAAVGKLTATHRKTGQWDALDEKPKARAASC